MSTIFPGNVLIIDDQFGLCHHPKPQDAIAQIQYKNFMEIKSCFENHGIQYAVIDKLFDFEAVLKRISQYQNIRLLILDLDLNETGEVEEDDKALVKKIILSTIKQYGYHFLIINSSYADKWAEIKFELLEELNKEPDVNKIEIHFLDNFCKAFNKNEKDMQDHILELLTEKYSNEVITQFECHINEARDKILGSFFEFNSNTWETVYKYLKEDLDSKEHISFVLNDFLIGMLKQHLVSKTFSQPNLEALQDADKGLYKKIIRGFNYLKNTDGVLEPYPIWTGNLYENNKAENPEKQYMIIITPECDIAQAKGLGYTVLYGFDISEESLPMNYKPADFINKQPPFLAGLAGQTKDGKWKEKAAISDLLKSPGYYPLLFASAKEHHIVLNLRSVEIKNKIDKDSTTLIARINEPIITDVMDRFSSIYNRKGLPRLIDKKFKLIE